MERANEDNCRSYRSRIGEIFNALLCSLHVDDGTNLLSSKKGIQFYFINHFKTDPVVNYLSSLKKIKTSCIDEIQKLIISHIALRDRKRLLLVALFLTLATVPLMAEQNQTVPTKAINTLKKPMYSPFVENYMLNELRLLRDENRELKVFVSQGLAEKERSIMNRVMEYSTSTVMNMFYIIAAASSILVLLGWNSFRDINERVKQSIDNKVHELIKQNELRMLHMEEDLEKRSKMVLKNQEEITKTNTIQSLWMRTGLEVTPSGKIEIYDQILKLRPDDPEVLSYKADAALEMDEANWALSLSNHALEIDDNYPNALFQRARAYIALGFTDKALDDLESTCSINEQYIEEIQKSKEFSIIENDPRYQALINKFEPSSL